MPVVTIRVGRELAVIGQLCLALASGPLLAQQRGASPATVEEGSRLYQANCAACHGADGDSVPGIDFHLGQFHRISSDEDLLRVITNGVEGTAMPPTSLTSQQVSAVARYVRSLLNASARSAGSGDPRRGQAVFGGKGGCPSCHRVKDKGSRVGPDLAGIGALRPVSELERSLLEPDAVVLPQNRFVRAVTREGVTITGRRLNEDTLTVQLIDSNERLVSLSKAGLREYTILKTSPMPSYRGKLSSQELADLISYLLTLRGADTP